MREKIKDYDNYYIYDNGDVLNINTGKILRGSIAENGYKYYRLSKNNKKKMFYAHRLVATHFLDNPNNLLVVNHIDGDKLNNNVDNLEWASYSYNVKHAHKNNLIQKRRKSEYYKKDLENEKWKKIINTNYSVSSCGRIKNDNTSLLLKSSICCGYNKIRLSNNGVVSDILVHNLVYMLFNDLKEIPEGYVVDHIDGDKLNNNINNLQLVTLSENVLNALYKTKTNKSAKAVIQLTLEDEYIAEFSSCAEAARQLKLDSSTISKVCRGINKSHGGYHFLFKETSTTILK